MRLMAVTTVVAVAVAVLVVAFVHSNSVGAARVAANAEELHWANATAGAAGILRASLAQAVFFSVDRQLGVASPEAAEGALTEASSNLEGFRRVLSGELGQTSLAASTAAEQFAAAAERVIVELEASNPVAAEQIRAGELEEVYARLADLLQARQAESAASISDTEAVAGRIAFMTQVAITLLVPATTMLVYWWLVRRRLRDREVEFNARLEAERAVSRAKDDFIAGVSHELRTPLTSIYGFSEVLIESGLVDPQMSMELVGLINHEAGELSRMVEDLLTASRLEAGALSVQIGNVDLREATDAVALPFLRNGVDLVIGGDPVTVEADALRLRQVLRNLISNAERHGGDRIMVNTTQEAGRARLSIADNGEGVPDGVEARMFERFVNEGSEALLAGSVGLGLAVAQALMKRMGGSVAYQRLDGWTIFSIDLAVAVPDEERSAEIPGLMAAS